jgi:hypothetical protein
MSYAKTGGAAFPRPYSQHNDSDANIASYDEQDGMTLLDRFAIAAVPVAAIDFHRTVTNREDYLDSLAGHCYAFAAAMLRAKREAEKPEPSTAPADDVEFEY